MMVLWVQAGTLRGWWDGGKLGRDPELVAEMGGPRQGCQMGDGDWDTYTGTPKWVAGPKQGPQVGGGTGAGLVLG